MSKRYWQTILSIVLCSEFLWDDLQAFFGLENAFWRVKNPAESWLYSAFLTSTTVPLLYDNCPLENEQPNFPVVYVREEP